MLRLMSVLASNLNISGKQQRNKGKRDIVSIVKRKIRHWTVCSVQALCSLLKATFWF